MIGSGERFQNNAVSVTKFTCFVLTEGGFVLKKSMRFQKYPGSCDVANSHWVILRYVMSWLCMNYKEIWKKWCRCRVVVVLIKSFSLRFVTRAAKRAGKADANHVETCREWRKNKKRMFRSVVVALQPLALLFLCPFCKRWTRRLLLNWTIKRRFIPTCLCFTLVEHFYRFVPNFWRFLTLNCSTRVIHRINRYDCSEKKMS